MIGIRADLAGATDAEVAALVERKVVQLLRYRRDYAASEDSRLHTSCTVPCNRQSVVLSLEDWAELGQHSFVVLDHVMDVSAQFALHAELVGMKAQLTQGHNEQVCNPGKLP